jgi:hypothetical protein
MKTTGRSDSHTMCCSLSQDKFEAEFRTPLPLVLTIIVGSTFLLMVMTFGAYDFFVMRRNRKIVDAAAKFNAIVSSLFPENVRKRLFAQADEKMDKKKAGDQFDRDGAHNLLKDFMADGNDMDLMDSGEGIYMKSKPVSVFVFHQWLISASYSTI